MRRTKAAAWRLAWALALAVVAGCAAPGAVIRGTLTPPKAAGAATQARGGMSEAVVYLDSLPAVNPRGASPRARARSTQLAFASDGFEPRVITISQGDSVVFTNHDRRWHSPFSVSAARRFELGSLSPGKGRAVRFDRSGVVRVFCKLHSEPSALVFVAPSPAWVHPDATGMFTLPALPPGRYEVRVWHPRYGERHWRVELPRSGVALALRM